MHFNFNNLNVLESTISDLNKNERKKERKFILRERNGQRRGNREEMGEIGYGEKLRVSYFHKTDME